MGKKELNIADSITPTAPETHAPSLGIKEAAKRKLEEFKKEEMRMVKGIFQNLKDPGGAATITCRKYPGHIFTMSLMDGQTYEIPLYVARFINGVDVTAGALGDANKKDPNIGTCSYPVHGFKMANGNLQPSQEGSAPGMGGVPVPIVGVVKRERRYNFQSMEFASGA